MAQCVSSPGEKDKGCRSRKPSCAIIRLFIVLIIPVIFLPLPIVVGTEASRAGYVLIIVAILWTTEALPLGVTALLPAALLPLLGVIPAKKVTLNYMKENIMLSLAGYVVAVCIEKWNLHRRIALLTMIYIGSTPARLLLGVMVTCMLLSMWISNTATTTMMIPIVEAILVQLRCHFVDGEPSTDENHALVPRDKDADKENKTDVIQVEVHSFVQQSSAGRMTEHQFQNLCKAMCLAVAYGACFGGSSTLIGSGAIIMANAHMEAVFAGHGLDHGVTFTNWMLFSLPISLINLAFGWLWLQVLWIGPRATWNNLVCRRKSECLRESTKAVRQLLHGEYKMMGTITFAEMSVLCHFIVLAILWLTRDPGIFPGWAVLFEPGYVRASTPALVIAILLFIFPSTKPSLNNWDYKPLMDLKTMMLRVPWHILLLIGGGMALADASQSSGLSDWLGMQMVVLEDVPSWLLVTVCCLLLSFFTEITSNVAVISIVHPILATMALKVGLNPLYLMIPGTVACTYAFMLPVATPPNAIVFSYGHLTVLDMARSGIVMNILGIVTISIAANTWGQTIFHYESLPPGWETPELTTDLSSTTLYS